MSDNCNTVDDSALNHDICVNIIENFDTFVYVSFPLVSLLLLLLLIMTIALICCCCKQWRRKKRMYTVDEGKDGGKNVIVVQILHYDAVTDKKFSNREQRNPTR